MSSEKVINTMPMLFNGKMRVICFLFCLTSVISTTEFDPKCVVDDKMQKIVRPVSWKTVNLDEVPSKRFAEAYAPHAEGIRNIVGLVRDTIGSFGEVPTRFIEVFVGRTVENLFPSEYKQEIQGIADVTRVKLEDLALLNAFYELSRFCTSILAETSDGHLIHGRNLDFGQLFGGWDSKTHNWRLSELLRKNSVNLEFKRNNTVVFKGTTIAGHVGILSGYRPGAFTLTINARLRTDFRNLLRWFTHLLKPERHLVLWVLRETLTKTTTFDEAKEYLTKVPLIADSYFILGGHHADEAVIITRNASDVVGLREMHANEWFLLQKAFYLDDRQKPGEVCMKEMTSSNISLQKLLRVLSSKPTLNKSTVHSVLMSLSTDEYYSFVQDCPDPCWFV